jgi:hypothetical protein
VTVTVVTLVPAPPPLESVPPCPPPALPPAPSPPMTLTPVPLPHAEPTIARGSGIDAKTMRRKNRRSEVSFMPHTISKVCASLAEVF